MKLKIIGPALPNLPWQPRPELRQLAFACDPRVTDEVKANSLL